MQNDGMMDEIRVKILDMSSVLHPADAYALVLEEMDGNRKLPVIIGALEAQAIRVEMLGFVPPRPLTHDLFVRFAERLGVPLKKILIYKVKDGVYYSYLFFDNCGEELRIDSRTSDAVALALRFKCPMYTTAEIMESEHLREVDEGAFSVTTNMVSLPMLKEALAKAVKEEDYEQASRLRDEIRRREEQDISNHTTE